jgi:DNA-binding transcriptional ArsR family regulator
MTSLYQDRAAAVAISEKLKVFAQPQRLMILSLLLSGEFSVSSIDETTGIGQPALSQQLAALRHADLVTTRREAKQIHYSLADEQIAACVRHIEALFRKSDSEARPVDPAHPPHRPPPVTFAKVAAPGRAKVTRSA